ncbi:YcxB family protein [Paludisphaera mucosa]|uniref:YcxB family protein n=1 Tax=Paludisphaera mucosa TaxID=3030827 RepID=A0ABT6FIT6_9BACT|nr:YcxB family protein [Paludisphaera mucosa]MDG3007492.1 YcxB family protein [Paludisphaera mucosa]
MDAEAPTLEGADEVVVRASYQYNEVEFIASRRASKIALNRSFDTWTGRITLLLLAHVMFAIGAMFMLQGLGPGARRQGPNAIVFAFGAILAAYGAWLAYRWLYGYRRRMRRLFHAFPAAGDRVDLAFTPRRLVRHSERSDSSIDWLLFPTVVELRDGFVLVMRARLDVWIPKHAFRPPFDARAAAAFLRSRAAKYRVLDRFARPAE